MPADNPTTDPLALLDAATQHARRALPEPIANLVVRAINPHNVMEPNKQAICEAVLAMPPATVRGGVR